LNILKENIKKLKSVVKKSEYELDLFREKAFINRNKFA